MKLTSAELETLEINTLLDVMYQRLGYDFRNYSRESIQRRLNYVVESEQVTSISELIPKIMHDELFGKRIIGHFLVNVTEMFRDPKFFRAVVNELFPVLETFPFFKIWHAGCSTGEEPYSLAILLKEHGLLDRARIYATDLSPNVIKKAKDGIFTEKKLVEYQSGYQQAGGQGALRDHFFVRYGSAKIDGHIRQRITFACHNLVTDSVFAEVQMIVCRNVMIYFDAGLKKHVLSLFSNALSPGGLLCLGSQESLEGVNDNGFEKLSSANRIYKKAHPTSKVVRMCH